MKRGRKYHGCGEEYDVERRERGGNIIFSIILKAVGKIIKLFFFKWGGEEYLIEFYTPLISSQFT